MTNMTTQYGYQVKVAELQINHQARKSKKYIINILSSSTMGFGCSPRNNTCDILSEYLASSIFQACYFKNGIVLMYIEKVNFRMALDPRQNVDINIVVRKSFYVRGMFPQSYFASTGLHNILHRFFIENLPFELFAYILIRYSTHYKLRL